MQNIYTNTKFFSSIVAAISVFMLAQTTTFAQTRNMLTTAQPEVVACDGCVFQIPNTAFYDDGGKSGAVSNTAQTTTFVARNGHQAVLFFEEIQLPAGAQLRIYDGKTTHASNLIRILTERVKMPNIIANAITIEYTPAYNASLAKGWKAQIREVLNAQARSMLPSQPESDCPNAINLCANNTVIALGGLYTDTGATQDDSGSCYSGTGSGGSVWYSFVPQTNGPVDFTLTPTGTTDYDFVLWDVTNGCGSGQRVELACNFSSATGTTGLNSTLCSESVGSCTSNDCTNQSKAADCNRFNNRVNVQTTKRYAICINFYGGSNDGFTLGFQRQASSVAITDNVPPTILNAYTTNCTSATDFHISFSEWLDCNTLQASDFTLPGHTITIVNTNCVNGRTQDVDITVAPPLTAGNTYTIAGQSVLDLCGNNLNATYNITLGATPTATVSTPAIVCKGTGFLGIGNTYTPANQNLTASGGTFYTWNTGQNGAVLSVAPTTNTIYTVTVVSGSCASTRSVSVSVSQATTSLGSDISYCGGTPITLTAQPATAGNNYQFYTNPNPFFGNGTSIQNGASNTVSVSPTANTTYRVVVTNANGCTALDDIAVTLSTGTTATITNPSATYCSTSAAFLLSATPSGGTFSGTGVSNNMFNPATAGVGTHTVNYTVTNNCGTFTGTATMTVATGAAPTLNLASNYCVGDPVVNLNPSVFCGTFTGSGITNALFCSPGFPPFVPPSYPSGPPTFSPAAAGVGVHTITYAGNNFCARTFTVTVGGAGLAPTISGANNTYCAGAAAVALTGTPAGGVFSGVGVSGTTFNPSTAGNGTHAVTYTTTSCGATVSTAIAITVTGALATASVTQPLCGQTGGAINVTAANATAYTWTGGLSGANPTNVPAGTYTVTVVTTNGCTATTAVTVNPAGSFVAAANPTPTNCGLPNGSIAVTPNNALTYAWTGGLSGANPTGVAAGTYTVTVTLLNGCTATAVTTVAGGTPINITANVTQPTCGLSNGSIAITPNNALSYAWTGGLSGANPTNLSGNVYTVTVTISAGCTTTVSAAVNNSSLPNATIFASNTGLTCVTTSTTLTANGGGTYNWGGGITTPTRTISAGGTYTVTVINTANNCTATASFVVPQNITVPNAGISSANNLDCTNTNSVLTASGGGNYIWDDGSTGNTLVVATADTYTVTVQNNTSGCTASANISVSANTTAPTAGLTSANNLTCTTTSSILTASGGVAYNFGSGFASSATQTVATAGTYTVTVQGANGCTATANISVSANTTAPTAGLTSANNLTCTTTSCVLTASGGGLYNFGSGFASSATQTVAAAGTYTVTVQGANGCTATANTLVTQNIVAPSAIFASANNLDCTTTSSVLTASGGGLYNFGSGFASSATQTVAAAGTYTVTVQGANGCTATANAVVTQNIVAPSATFASANNLDCATTSSVLTASGGGLYNFGSGFASSATQTVAAAGTYTVTVQGANGCTATANAVVTQNIVAPTPTLAGSTRFCAGTTTTLTASGGTAYNFGTGFGAVNTLVVTQTGIYTVTVRSANGCTASAFIDATAVTAPSISAGANITIKAGETVQINGNLTPVTPNMVYHWSAGFANQNLQSQTVQPTATTTYTVYAETPEGCRTNTDEITIDIEEELACGSIYEGFTPNGDGFNDTWLFPCLDITQNNRIQIYNRWGQILYETTNYRNDWDGTANGSALPDGTYYYIINVNKTVYKGAVTIIR